MIRRVYWRHLVLNAHHAHPAFRAQSARPRVTLPLLAIRGHARGFTERRGKPMRWFKIAHGRDVPSDSRSDRCTIVENNSLDYNLASLVDARTITPANTMHATPPRIIQTARSLIEPVKNSLN